MNHHLATIPVWSCPVCKQNSDASKERDELQAQKRQWIDALIERDLVYGFLDRHLTILPDGSAVIRIGAEEMRQIGGQR